MELEEESPVTLRDCDFIVTQKNGIDLICKYVRNTEVRDGAQKLIEAVAKRHAKDFFSDICGQCGACCRDRTIRLNAHDIQTLALHLGYTNEQQFRDEYIESSSTWNENDGILKKNGHDCVFLKKGFTTAQLCSVYPARPALCAAHPSNREYCRKNTGRLICHVFSLVVNKDSMIITMKNDASYTLSPLDDELKDLADRVWTAVANIPEEPDETTSLILNEALNTLNDLMRHYFTEGATPGFAEGLTNLLQMVSDLPLEQENCEESAQEILNRASFLQSLMNEASEARDSDAAMPATSRLKVNGIRLYPEWACVAGKNESREFTTTLLYSEHPGLLAGARKLIDMAASTPLLLDYLWHQDPRCFLCGECCRRFKVEITYPEIVRLAEYMKLSEEEIWERYFHPPIFSWNAKNGIIAKVDGAKLDTEQSSADCIFLEEKSRGVYHCRVYEGRPDVCSTFTPNNRPCRDLSLAARNRPLAANLHHIDLIEDRLYVTTHLNMQTHDAPVEIFTRQYPQVHTVCLSIRESVASSLGNAPENPGGEPGTLAEGRCTLP